MRADNSMTADVLSSIFYSAFGLHCGLDKHAFYRLFYFFSRYRSSLTTLVVIHILSNDTSMCCASLHYYSRSLACDFLHSGSNLFIQLKSN